MAGWIDHRDLSATKQAAATKGPVKFQKLPTAAERAELREWRKTPEGQKHYREARRRGPLGNMFNTPAHNEQVQQRLDQQHRQRQLDFESNQEGGTSLQGDGGMQIGSGS